MVKIVVPAGLDVRITNLMTQIERLFVASTPTTPTIMPSYEIGNLPNPAAYLNGMILVKDSGDINIGISNGTDWINFSTGSPF